MTSSHHFDISSGGLSFILRFYTHYNLVSKGIFCPNLSQILVGVPYMPLDISGGTAVNQRERAAACCEQRIQSWRKEPPVGDQVMVRSTDVFAPLSG